MTIQEKFERSHLDLFQFGPCVIGGTGGSGTRVVARIVQQGGLFIGTRLNESADAMDMAEYGDRWINSFVQHYLASQSWFNEPPMVDDFMQTLDRHLTHLNWHQIQRQWGWKAPRSIFLLPFLHRQFPRIKFVHVVRDGRDMALSANQNQLNKHGHLWLDPSEQAWNQPQRSIALWSRLNCWARAYAQQHLSSQYLQICFEELCANPIATVETLFKFLKLSGDVEAIAKAEVCPPVTIGRWRKQPLEVQIALQAIGQTALQQFGYLPSETSALTVTDPCTRLGQIRADLERSRLWLAQVKAELRQFSHAEESFD